MSTLTIMHLWWWNVCHMHLTGRPVYSIIRDPAHRRGSCLRDRSSRSQRSGGDCIRRHATVDRMFTPVFIVIVLFTLKMYCEYKCRDRNRLRFLLFPEFAESRRPRWKHTESIQIPPPHARRWTQILLPPSGCQAA